MDDSVVLFLYLVFGGILLRGGVKKSLWWIWTLAAGTWLGIIYKFLSLVDTHWGKYGLREMGYDPKSVLACILLINIAAVLFQGIGMIGCCFHFCVEAARKGK